MAQYLVGELNVAFLRDCAEVQQLEKAAGGRRPAEARIAQQLEEAVALGLIKRREPGIMRGRLLEEVGDRQLQRMRDAEGVELMHATNLARDIRRRDGITYSPAGGMHGLAE